MKYFIGKYWEMINTPDREIRKEGMRKWDEGDKAYYEYFQTIESKIPKGYLKQYYKTHGFHDYVMSGTKITNVKEGEIKVEFMLTHGDEVYLLTYSKVESIKIDIPEDHHYRFGFLEWGYSELELRGNGTWETRILFNFNCEIDIVFKRVSVKKLKKD